MRRRLHIHPCPVAVAAAPLAACAGTGTSSAATSGSTERISVGPGGVQANDSGGVPFAPSISADGRYVAFVSRASNLVAGDTNAREDVLVHDRQSRDIRRVSVDSSGAQSNSVEKDITREKERAT